MPIKGKIIFNYLCSVCIMSYQDRNEEVARTLALNCEKNKPKLIHTFGKGEVLQYTFYAEDDYLTRDVQVVDTFFSHKSHEPMYFVKEVQLIGVTLNECRILAVSADQLKKIIPAQTVADQTKV